ncbi:MAG: ParB/Srx family N-terminal domain-containing protein [Vibrio sp.]
MFFRFLLIISSALLSVTTQASKAEPLKVGDIIDVSLNELHPTQPAVGFDQVMYKLGRYRYDRKKMFDEICEANGQRGIASFHQQSVITAAETYRCKAPVGTEKQDMKTIVIAPNDQYYLTDGHHTFNAFYQMPKGGEHFHVHVLVVQDYRQLPNMTAFWQSMQQDGNVWLFDINSQPIVPNQLPKSLGLRHFTDDPYRSMLYFTRNISWEKPSSPVPFLEFYWAKELRKKVNLNQFDLNSKRGYEQAIRASSIAILSMQMNDVGGSHRSVEQMGQFKQFHQKGLDKLLKSNGKLDNMLLYKESRVGKRLSNDIVQKQVE